MNRKPQVRHHFPPAVWARGIAYAREGRVKNIQCQYSDSGSFFSADVSGTQRLPYAVEVRLVLQKHYTSLVCDCTCRVRHDCKHAAALLFLLETEHKLLENDEADELSEDENNFHVYEDLPWYAELNQTRDNRWFDFEVGVEINGTKVNILPALLDLIHHHKEAYTQKESVLLPIENVGLVQVPTKRLQNILSTLSELYDSNTLNHQHRLTMTKQRAAFLLEMQKALHITQTRWLGFEKLTQLAQALQSAQINEVPIPTNFHGELRDYQHAGLNWLQFLRAYQIGGILADDMGLGKTVQTLVHLQYEKNVGRLVKPCLIICPTSVLYNWQQEIARFTPELSSIAFYGPDRMRYKDLSKFDIVVTSYAVVLQDKHFLTQNEFYFLVLDEAQFIKNPRAKTSLVIQQLKAEHRLCLTGTPMENHLGDLWSLFHFLMPGFLGNVRQFNTVFRIPIEKKNDESRRELLARRTQPFLLRRTKEIVAQELPEKTLMIQPIELSVEQRDLYESIRLAMEQKIRQAIQVKGVQSSQIVILDALLKLRQVCCDPRVMRLSQGAAISEPVKLTWLLETLPNLLAEGRRVLLFSTFKSVLMNIAHALDAHHIPYVMLTGDTRDRKTPVEAFQNKKVPLFLISLKAGGVGLNLTAADTVIHYDPWWNPAAEAQATDRAHRIGQMNPVFVYKLIAKNTVEEKMLELQEKKSGLLSGILSATTSGFSLDADEIFALFQPD
jgi:SNF2 family DNA or RNA helicase